MRRLDHNPSAEKKASCRSIYFSFLLFVRIKLGTGIRHFLRLRSQSQSDAIMATAVTAAKTRDIMNLAFHETATTMMKQHISSFTKQKMFKRKMLRYECNACNLMLQSFDIVALCMFI